MIPFMYINCFINSVGIVGCLATGTVWEIILQGKVCIYIYIRIHYFNIIFIVIQ